MRHAANNAILALGPRQTFCLSASVDTDIIVDLNAEFGPAGTLAYLERTAVRVLDTRGGPPVAAGGEATFTVPPAPSGAAQPRAASVVITSTGHAGGGFVTSWGCGTRPATSTLNPVSLEDTANGAIAALGPGRRSCLFTWNATELIVDFSGWWI